MNLQAIVLVNAFGFVLLFLLLISWLMGKQRRRLSDKLFTALVIGTMTGCVIEPLSFWIDGRSGSFYIFLNMLSNTYLYTCNVLGCLCWLLYTDLKLYRDRGHLKKMLPIYLVFPIISISMLTGNLFGHYLFYVDGSGYYHRQPLCSVMYAFILLTGFMGVVVYYIARAKRGNITFFPIWMLMAPVFVGSVLQGLIYGVSLAWPGTAMGLAAMYMSIQNEKSFTDPLTGLYNRQYLEHMLYAPSRGTSYYGIMVDMDHFKSINDNFGHKTGDRALVNATLIMRCAVKTAGTVFRFAGDEFVILVKTDSEEAVIAIEQTIHEMADEFNSSRNEPYELGFSMGHAPYNPDGSQDDFLHSIDMAMYADKEERHRLYALKTEKLVHADVQTS